MSRFSSALLPKADKQTEALVERLDRQLDLIRSSSQNDPFSNSVLLAALGISRRIGENSLSPAVLEKLCRRLCLRAAAMRVEHSRSYLKPLGEADNLKTIDKIFAAPTFAALKKRVSSPCWGLVFTAHPTFALSAEALAALAELVCVSSPGAEGGKPFRKLLKTLAAARTTRPALEEEHRLSLRAIANARAAHKKLVFRLFAVARKRWGKAADNLHPNFMNIASWVGYDLDGRVDITWEQTFHKRLVVAQSQLLYYQKRASEVGASSPSLEAPLAKFTELLRPALAEMEEEIAAFAPGKSAEATQSDIAAISKRMYQNRRRRLTDPKKLLSLLGGILTKAKGRDRTELLTLMSEVEVFGIGAAHTHARINAKQLHNALAEELQLETDAQNWNSAAILRRLNELLANVKPREINFGSLVSERASAKRLVMLVRQMLRYVDSDTPIRLLIAECESSLDILAALYLVKLFGVEDKVDICPLFETEFALARGHRILAEVLRHPRFLAYVKKRGVITVETGWSDAGRHIGQCAAALSIENLHMNIARTLKAEKLGRLRLTIFDTHGESIGRGGYPKTLKGRFEYLVSPYSRHLFAKAGIAVKREVSFQGGDGYAWFMNEQVALAAICRGLEYFAAPPPGSADDKFYKEAEYAAEFTEAIKLFNKKVMNHNGYALLLGVFGNRLSGFSGSRPELRHGDAPPVYERVAAMRAIPQNSVLQQMGYLANSLGGLGQAHMLDKTKAGEMEATSSRFRTLMDIPRYALAFSDIELFAAYAAVLDPGMWLARAARSSQADRRKAMRKIYRLLEDWGVWSKIAPAVRLFRRDYDEVRSWLVRGEGFSVVGGGRVIPKRLRDELLLIHALRISLIQEVFVLTAKIPEFSYQFGHSYEELMRRFIKLDSEPAAEVLAKIFPLAQGPDNKDYGEGATYEGKKAGYRRLHEQITGPILEKTAQIRLLGQAVVNFIGAYG